MNDIRSWLALGSGDQGCFVGQASPDDAEKPRGMKEPGRGSVGPGAKRREVAVRQCLTYRLRRPHLVAPALPAIYAARQPTAGAKGAFRSEPSPVSSEFSLMADRYLFPSRWSRRNFLQATGVAAAGAALANVGLSTSTSWGAEEPGAEAKDASVTIGEGKFKYALDPNWGKLPEGMSYGYGCAIVVDGKDRIIVTSRSQNPCVAIFTPEGELVETWSKDFADNVGYTTEQVAGTAHGLYWSKEGRGVSLLHRERPGQPRLQDRHAGEDPVRTGQGREGRPDQPEVPVR
jgi:hypothetical protein